MAALNEAMHQSLNELIARSVVWSTLSGQLGWCNMATILRQLQLFPQRMSFTPDPELAPIQEFSITFQSGV